MDPALPREVLYERIQRILLGNTPVFVTFVLLATLARGLAATSPMWSIDGYWIAHEQATGQTIYTFLLSQGRYGEALLTATRDAVGIYGADVTVASIVAAIVLHVHSGLLLAHVVFRHPTPTEVGVFLTLYVLHPFYTEFFYFTTATLVVTVAFWLASLGLYLTVKTGSRGRLALIGSCTLLVMAFAIYQTAIAYVAVVAALAIGARIALLDRPIGVSTWWTEAVRIFGIAMASVALYLVSLQAVSAVSGVQPDARLSVAGDLADLAESWRHATDAFVAAIRPWSGIVPGVPTAILLILLVLSIGLVLWRGYRNGYLARAIVCALLMGAALFSSAALPTVGDTTWYTPVPRFLVAFSVAAAGILMMGWGSASLRALKIAMVIGLAVLLVSYVGASNRILADQRRVNQWDTQLMNRVVARWESDPAFARALSIAMVGTDVPYSEFIETWVGAQNRPAPLVRWAQLGLIEQASGYRFRVPTDEDWARAENYCERAPLWPMPRSTTIIGSVAIVCLTTPGYQWGA